MTSICVNSNPGVGGYSNIIRTQRDEIIIDEGFILSCTCEIYWVNIELRTSLFSLTVGDSGGVSDTKDFDFATPVHSGLVLKELLLCKIHGVQDIFIKFLMIS